MVWSFANAEKETVYWKNFDDGMTFYFEDKSDTWSRDVNVGIVLDGENIQCDSPLFMHGGLINPECIEIILRHELDRRGL